ncbi:hypothetical protein OXPF_26260 [Oxobacter pfennigii]|uniref:Phosphatidylglycerol lysyltransferase C-terminal domain-containing protein n=2 Tax=Oxobacter pfennigii TaxID=36849 RepID=A0A0P8W7M3_9CLOT|nr:hypothetical protein OXPF_26260 [Oxobacter pfennigii]
MKFKPLGLEDRELFMKYMGEYYFNTYEYSFATLYLWRKMCNVEYAVCNDILIIKKSINNMGSYFMQPIGYDLNNLEDIILKLDRLEKECGGFINLFRDVELPFLHDINQTMGEKIKFVEDTDNFDYIYNSKDLIELTGNKYHGKKNHYNQFVNNYDYVIKEIKSREVIQDCMDFSLAWYESKEEKSEQLKFELYGVKDVLNNMEELNLLGMAVYVEGKMAGFTIGEKVNEKMAIIHVEKGDPEYKGIYAFINKEFAERNFSEVEFLNREEDLGIEGLRKVKSSYHPVRLEKKYIVDLQ